uniref:PRAME nuclear receptor transcriptional regulator n=1 Tax=Pipistrellus kuhlii TaxID=59472 RepID=A0A7J8A8H1_PIPKU|nr:hypothetical protein mPipKuh1_009058 [Pipistrellus kuhlii]
MSIKTPPTLLHQAGESLLRDQALAIAALEHLPAELFPQLFIQAYRSRRLQVLKAMSQAWPFTVLPLGGLPDLSLDEVFKAILDGLDLLLAQEVRPSCLQTPLDRLSIKNCRHLMHSDLTHLFQCPKIRQLKTLYLFALSLKHFKPEPLRALLEAVAPTLQDLGLDNCEMVDSQVEAMLAVLSRCHQLRFFTITGNDLSLTTLEKLLRHTAGLSSLELELYPVPLECYTTQGTVKKDRLALVRAELTGILRELGKPRIISLGTKYCQQRGISKFYKVEF